MSQGGYGGHECLCPRNIRPRGKKSLPTLSGYIFEKISLWQNIRAITNGSWRGNNDENDLRI
jgi:hypothetical protein